MNKIIRPKDSPEECETQEERRVLIEHWLSTVEQDLEDKDRTNDFIESLREQFDRKGNLSQKQLDALEKFYERI